MSLVALLFAGDVIQTTYHFCYYPLKEWKTTAAAAESLTHLTEAIQNSTTPLSPIAQCTKKYIVTVCSESADCRQFWSATEPPVVGYS